MHLVGLIYQFILTFLLSVYRTLLFSWSHPVAGFMFCWPCILL